VTGEIDMSTCAELAGAITPHLGAGHTVVIDLSGVTFFDSSAIRVLIQSRDRALTADSVLAIRDPSDLVRRVLTVAGVLDLFGDAGSS
jgi:anti-sigma B factor antagonist